MSVINKYYLEAKNKALESANKMLCIKYLDIQQEYSWLYNCFKKKEIKNLEYNEELSYHKAK